LKYSDWLYSRDVSGRIRVWRYVVDGARWCTESGLIDGERVTTGWTTCTPKSQSTAEAQALFEADAELRKKLKRKYRESIDDVDLARGAGVKPMLASKYERWRGPCYGQPKLDGIRCLANADGLWSRSNERIVSCPHVEAELEPLFDEYPDLVLDGELYNHSLRDDFNALISHVRKTKPSEDDKAACAGVVQYHVYDLVIPGKFSHRLSELHRLVKRSSSIELVTTYPLNTPDELDSFYSSSLELGYEGMIVRLDAEYEQKRSKSLLKRKEFLDGEFEFVEFEMGNGNWANVPKRATCRLSDGRVFGAGIKGDTAYCLSLLDGDYRTVTVRYFTPTPDGIPRFPVAVAFYERDVREM
jgi:DNA ligase-1